MKKIKLYTKPDCPFCVKAKKLLTDNGYEYEDVDVIEYPEIKEKLIEVTGQTTVPFVFVGNELIGGSSDLEALMNAGVFENLVKD